MLGQFSSREALSPPTPAMTAIAGGTLTGSSITGAGIIATSDRRRRCWDETAASRALRAALSRATSLLADSSASRGLAAECSRRLARAGPASTGTPTAFVGWRLRAKVRRDRGVEASGSEAAASRRPPEAAVSPSDWAGSSPFGWTLKTRRASSRSTKRRVESTSSERTSPAATAWSSRPRRSDGLSVNKSSRTFCRRSSRRGRFQNTFLLPSDPGARGGRPLRSGSAAAQ